VSKTSPKDWRDSAEGIDHIKEVLQKSGVPLETRVLNTVRDFCAGHSSGALRAADLGPASWREKEEDAYREVDSMAVLSESMLFGHVEVRIRGYFLIEAKYREGVEWFAFDSPHSATLPADSNAPFSTVVTDLYNNTAEQLKISRLAALKTGTRPSAADTSAPFKEENLSQNVAGELANVASHIAGNLTESTPRPLGEDQGQELLSRFKDALATRGGWRETLRTFLDELPATDHQRFLNENSGSHPLTLRVFIPILVVNGRINHAAMDAAGAIGDITTVEYVVTGERLRGWPPREPFISRSIQFPVICANPDGLGPALNMGYDYVLKIRNAFAASAHSGALNGTSLDGSLSVTVVDEMSKPVF
jgi:hypothetical protein